jgi:hypothetical protein
MLARPLTDRARRWWTGGGLTAGWLALSAGPALAQEAPGAGGASSQEVVVSLIAGVLFLAGCAGVAVAHREGRFAALDRAADRTGRFMGLPGWAALPMAIGGISLIVAVFGFYWDVATHIDHGRDDGVFGNAAHWPILVGLTGLALAGLASLLLGVGDDERARGLSLPGWWRPVPIGGALLFLCGVVALAGFPIDDVWHRIFGQDVTLWSPPHIQMVLGASLCTIALWVLFVEAERVVPTDVSRRRRYVREVMLAGAALIGLSTLQGEFDFGVPQFRLLFQPLLIAVAAGIALVAARIRLGRGGALLAVGFFLTLRVLISLVVSGAFEHVTFHLPLYLGAAVAVELVALVVRPSRQLTFGLASGLGIGTFGLAVEAAWTQVAMPIPWTTSLFPEALLVVPVAVAAGLLGGFLGRALGPVGAPIEPAPSWYVPAAVLVLVAALAFPLATTSTDARAHLQLASVDGPTDGDHVEATITIDPPELAADPEWLHVIAWQGAGWWSEEATQVQPLEAVDVAEGTYRTTAPVPVHGEWKAVLRVQDGRVLAAAPIFLPEDAGIPVEEVPAEPEVTREFVADHEILLREARPVPSWVVWVAHTLMVLLGAAWAAAFGFGTRRLRRDRPEPTALSEPRPERTRPAAPR